jgi:pullulanase/glycogen debranching enzyme
LRRELRPLSDRWYSGRADAHGEIDLSWWHSDGTPLAGDAWDAQASRVLGALIRRPGRAGKPLLLLLNPLPDDHPFVLPLGSWQTLVDTAQPDGGRAWQGATPAPYPLCARSLALLASA